LRKYSNSGTHTTEEEEALFLAMSFWFSYAVCPTERTNRRENRDTRKERKKKEGKKQPQTHSPLFKAERKHKRKELVSLSLSQRIMASPEAAAILRELQGKNGNGVRF
tara:strand:- start:312 stop:635 length:324 start_codon:yes stop_codon:yes gene_type:complete